MFFVVNKSAVQVTVFQPEVAKTFYNQVMIDLSFVKCNKICGTSLPVDDIVYFGF